jgi:hypothetical protein
MDHHSFGADLPCSELGMVKFERDRPAGRLDAPHPTLGLAPRISEQLAMMSF